jgi:hypothetical protein
MSIILNGDNGDTPSRKTLQGLFKALPGYVESYKKKAAAKKAMRATHATLPRKVCKICCKAFDLAYVRKDDQIEAAVCEDCQKMLDTGHVALIEGMRYAFIMPKGDAMADMRGKIVPVSTETMNAIQKRMKEGK